MSAACGGGLPGCPVATRVGCALKLTTRARRPKMPPFQHICSLLAWTPLPLRNEPRYFFNSSDDPCVKDPAKCTANLQASTQAGLL